MAFWHNLANWELMLPKYLLNATKVIVENTVCNITQTCPKLHVRDSCTAVSLIPRGNRCAPALSRGTVLSRSVMLTQRWTSVLRTDPALGLSMLSSAFPLPWVQANNVLIHYLFVTLFCWATLSTEIVLENFVQVFYFPLKEHIHNAPCKNGNRAQLEWKP